MKKILLLILLAGAAQATEVYRYTDENGVTHYTDKAPSKDAAPAKLPALQTMPSLSGKVNTSTSSASAPKVFVPDFSLSISSPTPEQTFRNPGEAVEVSVSVMPGLAAGYGLIYSVDGSAQNPDPTLSTSLSLPARKMKGLFKRWLEWERRAGGPAEVEAVKQRAMEFVQRSATA